MNPSRAFAFTGLAVAGVCAAVAVLTGIAFAVWAGIDNSITWPALENSTTPHYPAGHALFGWALGVSLWASTALAVAALCAVLAGSRMRWTRARAALIIVLASYSALIAPAVIESSPVALVLALPAIAVFALVLRARKPAGG